LVNNPLWARLERVSAAEDAMNLKHVAVATLGLFMGIAVGVQAEGTSWHKGDAVVIGVFCLTQSDGERLVASPTMAAVRAVVMDPDSTCGTVGEQMPGFLAEYISGPYVIEGGLVSLWKVLLLAPVSLENGPDEWVVYTGFLDDTGPHKMNWRPA